MQNKFQCDISLKTDDTKLKKKSIQQRLITVLRPVVLLRSLYDITLN